MAGLSSLPSLRTAAPSLSSNMFRQPSPLLGQLQTSPQLSTAGLLSPSLLQSQAPLMHSHSHSGAQADLSHLTGHHLPSFAAQSATNSAYPSPALSAAQTKNITLSTME